VNLLRSLPEQLLRVPATMLQLPLRPLRPEEGLSGGSGPSTMASDPPVELPPGRLIHVRGRGEFFVRDTGGSGPAVVLLHGWMFPSDLNWFRLYAPLAAEGYRVVAMDCRGHGRGLRPVAPFRFEDCADDVAGVIDRLELGPSVLVGYSMGGPIAQLTARRHRDHVAGLVLCATAHEWRDLRMKALWNTMGGLRLFLELFPRHAWRWALRAGGFPDSPTTSWVTTELARGSPLDIAEAGRELGRYDSRPWIHELAGIPSTVVVTTRDTAVPPEKQYQLAASIKASVLEVATDHSGIMLKSSGFCEAIVEALDGVVRERPSVAA
jgi:3-oxoadipate enol-lactonase